MPFAARDTVSALSNITSQMQVPSVFRGDNFNRRLRVASSQIMWSRTRRCSQLIWSRNHRARRFMLSGRYTWM